MWSSSDVLFQWAGVIPETGLNESLRDRLLRCMHLLAIPLTRSPSHLLSDMNLRGGQLQPSVMRLEGSPGATCGVGRPPLWHLKMCAALQPSRIGFLYQYNADGCPTEQVSVQPQEQRLFDPCHVHSLQQEHNSMAQEVPFTTFPKVLDS